MENQEAYFGHRNLRYLFTPASETIKWAFGYTHVEIGNVRVMGLEIAFKAMRVDKIFPKKSKC